MSEKITALRYKYKKRFLKLHPAARLLLIGLCLVLFVLGLIALLPLPELGIPLVLVSLSVLSFQYTWAEQLLNRFEEIFSNKIVKIILLVVGIIAVAAFLVIWFK